MRTKEIRIFISSTFRDMWEERNLLVTKVFPAVAEHCRALGINPIEVDLRWGITAEQSAKGEVVDICLEEIDRCRPFFIGLLGECYGWIPDGSGISVTEQEINYGALNCAEVQRAFFYIRSRELSRKLAPSTVNTVPDPAQEKLKDRVRASGYEVLDGYLDMNVFADKVRADLITAIDSEYPRGTAEISAKEQQLLSAEYRAASFIGRTAELQRLAELVEATGRPEGRETGSTAELTEAARRLEGAEEGRLIAVCGETGAGKSALLASFVCRASEEGCVIPYFAEAGAGIYGLVMYLKETLVQEAGLRLPEVSEYNELKHGFATALRLAAERKKKIIIIIDGLEELAGKQGEDLSWLPAKLPVNVCVIFSCTGDASKLALLNRPGCIRLELAGFAEEEKQEVTKNYLGKYSKQLDGGQLELIAGSPKTSNALFLRAVLEEIRTGGVFEKLTGQIEVYLGCDDLKALFDRILQRCENDYSFDGRDICRDALTLLTASGAGLSEDELTGLLKIPQAGFAPLRRALRPYIIEGVNGIAISCVPFAEAVRLRYGIDGNILYEARQKLIDRFLMKSDETATDYRLPWLLRQNGRLEELYAYMCSSTSFLAMEKRNRYELKQNWKAVSEALGHSAAEYAECILGSGEPDGELMVKLGRFLLETGDTAKACAVLGDALKRPELSYGEQGRIYGMLGNIFQSAGRYSEAEEMYRKKYGAAQHERDRYEQHRALGNLGILYQMEGNLKKAREAFLEALKAAEALNRSDLMQTALGNMGNIYFSENNAEQAEKCYRRQLQLCLESGELQGEAAARGALGMLCLKQGRTAEAEELFTAQLRLGEANIMPEVCANALGSLAMVRLGENNPREAERLMLEKLKLCREAQLFLGEQNALGNLISLAEKAGDYGRALEYADSLTELTGRTKAFRQYARALHIKAVLLSRMGSREEAEKPELTAKAIAHQQGYRELLAEIEKAGIL